LTFRHSHLITPRSSLVSVQVFASLSLRNLSLTIALSTHGEDGLE
jgi:hypothetical protein